MPYPLEKLPYGLRRRLRKLATPNEAYAFQTAAPYYYGFQPIQKLQPVLYAKFLIDEKSQLLKIDCPEYSSTNSDQTTLYMISYSLTFQNFTTNCQLKVLPDVFRFAPKNVYFYNCTLDTNFVQSFLVSTDKPIERIEFYPCSFTSESAAKMLCNATAFKALESFNALEPMFPSSAWWIEAFEKSKCTSLKEFDVYDAPIFNIDDDVFLKFIKAQCENFRLNFFMSDQTDLNNAGNFLKTLVEKHFEGSHSAHYSLRKKFVKIYFESLKWCYTFRDD